MPKFHSIETIPAKVFFKILETKNYQLLKPKPSEKDLEQVFISIYDDFFIKSDNNEAKQYLETTTEIAKIKYKIATLKQSLHFYFYNKTTEKMRDEFIESLQIGYGITIDKEQPFIDEVQRLLTIEIGILENDLTFAENNYLQMIKQSSKKAFDYEENIVSMENVLKRNINDGIMLDKYIAYGKNVKNIVEQQQKNKRNV
jgi:hypothetical protein